MIPVFQTKRGMSRGDCLRASVASVLELGLECVVEFTPENWYQQLNDYLSPRGLIALILDPESPDSTFKTICDETFYILAGQNKHGGETDHHAVVGCAGGVVHDPSGGDTEFKDGTLSAILFVKIL